MTHREDQNDESRADVGGSNGDSSFASAAGIQSGIQELDGRRGSAASTHDDRPVIDEVLRLLDEPRIQSALTGVLALRNPSHEIKSTPRRLLELFFPRREPLRSPRILEVMYALAGEGEHGRFPAYRPRKTQFSRTATVATIVDEFTHQCIQYEWNLVPLTRADWREQIETGSIDFLFVESAWRGFGDQWNHLVNHWEKEDNPVRDVVGFCRDHGIPTVFWNKEDPPNFDGFKGSAIQFDYIFTTDADCIPRYLELCDHDRVYALPFAAQPVIHNPTARARGPWGDVAFGGGWYQNKHTARRAFLPILLDGALASRYSLTIFDRFSQRRGRKRRRRHRFPARYARSIRSAIPYSRMLSAYRRFPVFLNVNSVTDSPTMLSRRVFELLACGTQVVSGPSLGMEKLLGPHVAIVSNEADARAEIEARVPDTFENRVRAHLGYRHVMTAHTYRHRCNEVLARIGRDDLIARRDPMVSVIAVTNRPERLECIVENYRRQRWGAKELLVVLNSDAFDDEAVGDALSGLEDARVYRLPERETLATCLNEALEHVRGDYWAKMDDDDYYGAHYLSDSLLPFEYTDASIVGKGGFFLEIRGEEGLYLRRAELSHSYSHIVSGATIVARREVADRVRFDSRLKRGADTAFLRAAARTGHLIYSSDPFNFVLRRDRDGAGHTWQLGRDEILKMAAAVPGARVASDVDI